MICKFNLKNPSYKESVHLFARPWNFNKMDEILAIKNFFHIHAYIAVSQMVCNCHSGANSVTLDFTRK